MPATMELASRRDRLTGGAELPRRWMWLIPLFRWYAHRYVRKHFHAVRLSLSGHTFSRLGDEPLLIVLNHPSWWDPMICIILSRLMAERDQFGAIDSEAVKQYGFFKKIGCIGVDTKSIRGAAEFVRTGTTILSQPNRVYWVTGQGRFSDVRERPLALATGVGHLASRMQGGIVLPLALDYTFWTESCPEALVRVGKPLHVVDHPELPGKEWTELIEAELTRNLDTLNDEAMSRDPAKFTTLLSGRTGIGGPYDWWRRLKAWVRGRTFDASHDTSSREKRS